MCVSNIERKRLRALLQRLRPGEALFVAIAGDQPFNRNFYLRVNSVAYCLFGSGGYQMRAGRGEVGVIRRAAE